MEDRTKRSLAVALDHVLRSFGQTSDPETLYDRIPGLFGSYSAGDVVPGLSSVDHGAYGTYPTTTPSIVFFDDSTAHYVDVPADRTIIDSFDGTSKSMQHYGTPTTWMTFAFIPPVVTPSEPMIYKTNTVDGIAYESFGVPRRMYIRKAEGADLIDFSGRIKTFRDFIGIPNTHKEQGAPVRVIAAALYPLPPQGQRFYITIDDFGEFTRTGHIARLQGYYDYDLADTPPVDVPNKIPIPSSLTTSGDIRTTAANMQSARAARTFKPVTDVRPTHPAWKTSYRAWNEPVEYVSEDNSTVMFYNLDDTRDSIPLNPDFSAVIVGETVKDGIRYLREGKHDGRRGKYYAEASRLIPRDEAEALVEPTIAERLQITTDPQTGKPTHGGRFTTDERFLWIPFAYLSATYTRFNNKFKKK